MLLTCLPQRELIHSFLYFQRLGIVRALDKQTDSRNQNVEKGDIDLEGEATLLVSRRMQDAQPTGAIHIGWGDVTRLLKLVGDGVGGNGTREANSSSSFLGLHKGFTQKDGPQAGETRRGRSGGTRLRVYAVRPG